jgi:hypothetical protein
MSPNAERVLSWWLLGRALDGYHGEGEELVRKFLIDRFCENHGVTPAKVDAVLSAWEKFETITPTLH